MYDTWEEYLEMFLEVNPCPGVDFKSNFILNFKSNFELISEILSSFRILSEIDVNDFYYLKFLSYFRMIEIR